MNGILTLYDASFQRTSTRAAPENVSLNYNSCRRILQDFKFELFPLHSPLLGESLLVSFPPLIDMLKFSGFSCPISDQVLERPLHGAIVRLPRWAGRKTAGGTFNRAKSSFQTQGRLLLLLCKVHLQRGDGASAFPMRLGRVSSGEETAHPKSASLVVPPGTARVWRELLLILKRACSPEYRRAQCAFKDSMIH